MNDAILAQQRLMQAIQNYQTGDLSAAEKDLKDLHEKFPKSDQILTLLGTVIFAQKKHKEAFRNYREALKINPDNEDALINIGTVEKARGNFDSALSYMQQALKKLPSRADIYYNLGTVYAEKEDLDNAEASFLKCLQMDERIYQVQVPLAEVYIKRGKLEQAEEALLKARQWGNTPEIQALLNKILNLKGETITEENTPEITPIKVQSTPPVMIYQEPMDEDSTEKALGIDGNDIQSLLDMAVMFHERFQVNESEKYYQKVLQKAPNHPQALNGMRKLRSYKIPGWHFDMLEDSARNDAFQEAIERVLRKLPGARVLDIGTGSGLLAMMAARAGASEVVACEMHKDLSEIAKEIVASNGYADKIKVINKKSTDLVKGVDYDEKFDIIVSEILDCGGLGEGVIPSLRHAKQKLLKPRGIMIPEGVTLHGQLIEIPHKYKMNPINQISGFDLSAFNQFKPIGEYTRVYLQQEPHKTLSNPFPLKKYNFHQLTEALAFSEMLKEQKRVRITNDGQLQAVAFWFDLHMDGEKSYSSGPRGSMVHWGQAIYYLNKPKIVKEGTEELVDIHFSDTLLQFNLPG